MATFTGFLVSDFDAYEERKWASNRFNLERMRVREKVEALLAEALTAEQLSELGLSVQSSQDHPTVFNHRRVDSQWVYASRNAEARRKLTTILERERPLESRLEDSAEHHLHALLGVEVHQGGLDVLFGVHRNAWVDSRNFSARLTEAYDALQFFDFAKGLGHSLLVERGDKSTPVEECDHDGWREFAGKLNADGPDEWLRVVRHIDRSDELLLSAELVRVVAHTLAALIPVYRFVAWRPDNDHIGLQRTIKEERKVAKAQAGAQAASIEARAEVRITHGLFAGKVGQVLELDGKGSAKVMIGTVPVKVRVSELQRI